MPRAQDAPERPTYRSRTSGELHDPLWRGDRIALRVIDAEAAQHLDDLHALGELRDRLLAGEMADFVDRAHHLAIDRIVQDLLDEAAVDLQEIDREVLQVTERRQAGAEVVEREAAAELF